MKITAASARGATRILVPHATSGRVTVVTHACDRSLVSTEVLH